MDSQPTRAIDIAVSLLILLTAWQLVVWVTGVPSFILPGPMAVAGALVVSVSAASAANVKVTPLGSHDGEFCRFDRAIVFEDPDGTRILYDAGRTVAGVGLIFIGNADLSRLPTVQTNGAILLPLLGEVQVAGLTVAEIRRKVTSLLEKDYLVNPQVVVKVSQYNSQYVTVVGEVKRPGRKPLRGRTRLIDVLAQDAEGFTTNASGEVVIAREDGTFPDGERVLTETDEDDNGEPDSFRYFVDGVVERRERDTTGDGRVDTWEFFNSEGVARIGVDEDADGVIDVRTE